MRQKNISRAPRWTGLLYNDIFIFSFISTIIKFPIYLCSKFYCLLGLLFALLIRIIA
jgi:hypothetical protein